MYQEQILILFHKLKHRQELQKFVSFSSSFFFSLKTNIISSLHPKMQSTLSISKSIFNIQHEIIFKGFIDIYMLSVQNFNVPKNPKKKKKHIKKHITQISLWVSLKCIYKNFSPTHCAHSSLIATTFCLERRRWFDTRTAEHDHGYPRWSKLNAR